MKKKLNADTIQSELSDGFVFFQGKPKHSPPPHTAHGTKEPPSLPQQKTAHPRPPVIKVDTQQSPNVSSMHASTIASMQANTDDALIETIRKTVKQIGKETTFLLLTPEEKKQLREIDYTYKSQGIKISENEIGRIGINFLLEDYKAHGEANILAKVLVALNA
jgi:hypothetical protein